MSDYFSLTDILVTEERMSVELQQSFPKLGFLSHSAKDVDLNVGAKLELPLWLASALCTRHAQLVSCEMPKVYRESYREILQADACAVELAKWGQHYYELGLQLGRVQLMNVGAEEARRIAEFLLQVFRSRFRVIMDSEQCVFGTSALSSHSPPVLEKKLIEQGSFGKQQLLNWMIRGVRHIKTSTVLNNIKKQGSAVPKTS
ncbi:DNA replication complex GINS protein PSF3 [Copidosoma floridanum]|uniref:DNA replication complex GINS protein PSF3 n=1 Tax=Copidosoma floridanum TaxID=29053 RepID=UPI0006C9B023|nr:DNA replication complex GINS protein PSF3 [Copidosoma floridanum]